MKIPRGELAHDGGCGKEEPAVSSGISLRIWQPMAHDISIYVLVLASQLAANASCGHAGIAALGTVMVEYFHCVGPGQTF